MKKLIAILVVFALVAGSIFAADFGGHVIGTVIPIIASSEKDANGDLVQENAEGGGGMNRIRLQGSGENDDGTFGAWVRLEDSGWPGSFQGLAWWKPIDQFKLSIGGNSDGIYGKEGYAGWMFHQIVADTGVVKGSQAWGCAYTLGAVFRDAFFGGFGGKGLMLDIQPVEMVGINVAVPFIDMAGSRADEIIRKTVAQLDVNLDFGNIALTYVGGFNKYGITEYGAHDPGKFHLFFGLSAVDNLDLAVSLAYALPLKEEMGSVNVTYNSPLAFGVGAKYAINDDFAIKTRILAEFLGSEKSDASGADPVNDPFELVFELLPIFKLNDLVTLHADLGMNFVAEVENKVGGVKQKSDSVFGWHLNPYVSVGQEWGPTFFAGINIYSTGAKAGKVDEEKTYVQFEVPIALVVSF